MENNNLENNIKRSFEQYNHKLDHDEIWDNIEPKLKRKKKRRFLILWFFGGLATIGLLYTFINKDPKVVTIDNREAPSSISPSTDSAPSDVIRLQNDKTESLVQQENKTNAKPYSIRTLSGSSNDYTPTSIALAKPLRNIASLTTKMASQRNEPLANSSVYLTPSTAIESLKRVTKSAQIPIPPNENDIKDTNDITEQVDVTIISNQEDQPNKAKFQNLKRKRDKQEKVELEKAKKLKIKKEKIRREEIKRKKIKRAKAKKEKARKDKMKREKERKVAVRHSRKKTKWFIQPTLGAIVPVKILGANSVVSEADYINQRQETETRLEAFSVGLNIQTQNRIGFIISAGLEIQRLNSRFDFENTTVEQEFSSGVISVTENAQGEAIRTELGEKEKTITTTKRQQHFNQHTFINVPIGIGKIWRQRKYDFRFVTGVDVNLYHNFRGLIAGPGGQDLDLRRRRNSQFDQVFKRNTGIGIWATTEFHKPIGDKWNLSFAPKIQVPLNKITQDEYVLNQRFLNFSLVVGANLLISSPKKKPSRKKDNE